MIKNFQKNKLVNMQLNVNELLGPMEPLFFDSIRELRILNQQY